MKISDRARIFRSYTTMELIAFTAKKDRGKIYEKITKYRPDNLSQLTPAEERFVSILTRLGIGYRREIPVPCDGKIYFIDFVIGEPYWIAIEIDGGVHKKQQEYDCARDMEIMGLTGWTILRFDNNEIRDFVPMLLENAMWEILDVEKNLVIIHPKGMNRNFDHGLKSPTDYLKYSIMKTRGKKRN
ncbi:MAG: DUF559 domain-containing protein [Candidatus Rickettsiella isopodorum]|nr:DUF559 domain-containing protein [Candidatus Rickettsiella isopodorum]